MVYQAQTREKPWFIVFHHITSSGRFRHRLRKTFLFKKAAESFEEEINITNKEEEAKTVEVLRFGRAIGGR